MISAPVLVKDALRDGSYKKNYRIIVYKEDESTQDFVIENDRLVAESVEITERMCSEKEIKFGLCEGTNLEFQCFNVPNITGRRIKVYLDCQYKDEHGELMWYPITIGWFTVDECSRQASTGILKVQCYNKLLSDYLDQKANTYLQEKYAGSLSEAFYKIRQSLLDEYEINTFIRRKWGVGELVLEQVTSTSYAKEGDIKYSRYFAATNVYPIIVSYKYTIELDPNCFYRFAWANGNVDDYETLVYSWIRKSMIDSSFLTSYQEVINTKMLTSYNTFLGCYMYFGVVLTKTNDQEEIYSKWAYDNNKFNAVGPISDLFKDYMHGYKKITLYMPLGFSMARVNAGINYVSKEVLDGKECLKTVREGSQGHFIGQYLDEDGNHKWWIQHNTGSLVPTTPYLFSLLNFSGVYNDFYVNPSMYAPTPRFDEILFSDGSSTSDWIAANYNEESEYHVNGGAVPVEINNLFIVDETEVVNDADLIEVDLDGLADITAREAVSAVYELSACYGKLDRESDLFAPIELNHSRLLPADDLYPANVLYPMSVSERSNKSMYSKLWADEGNVHTFRYLIITYKTLESSGGQTVEVEKTLQRTVNENGTDNYNMSDNWLFKNLVWTPEQVGVYADAMVEKMRNLKWFPFEMWCTGLPYIEVGDELEINMGENTYITYLLTRKIKGIQNLQDEMINGKLNIF